MSDVMRDAYCVLRNTKYAIRNTKYEIRFISQNIHLKTNSHQAFKFLHVNYYSAIYPIPL
jgi:hypothetical protein